MNYSLSYEANSCLASKEIPPSFMDLKFQDSVHKSQPLNHILSQMNPVKIRVNIIIPSTVSSPKWYFSFSFRPTSFINFLLTFSSYMSRSFSVERSGLEGHY